MLSSTIWVLFYLSFRDSNDEGMDVGSLVVPPGSSDYSFFFQSIFSLMLQVGELYYSVLKFTGSVFVISTLRCSPSSQFFLSVIFFLSSIIFILFFFITSVFLLRFSIFSCMSREHIMATEVFLRWLRRNPCQMFLVYCNGSAH